jgi:hypothetical protein
MYWRSSSVLPKIVTNGFAQSTGHILPGPLKIVTPIPAKILRVDKNGDQHRVRIELGKYRGSFNTLKFGEYKLHIGFCHDGRLDLIYYRDPGLKEGQPFPLWTIQ